MLYETGSTRASAAANGVEKLCAPAAALRKPENVMQIWIVEKNRFEFFVSFCTAAAFLLPSSAIFATFASLSVMTAISEAEKKPFTNVRIISRITFSHGKPLLAVGFKTHKRKDPFPF